MRFSLVLPFFGFPQFGYASPVQNDQTILRGPLVEDKLLSTAPRKLHGRFLHITDLHSDSFYKAHSSTKEEDACHRGSGPAGTYGAETSDCDSPLSLIDQTFKWIENNLKDTVDFVVWTGDSARHDNDENIPRSEAQVLGLNKYIARKFMEVFGEGKDELDETGDLIVPVVPTFGNNDILPHNILLSGPNKWLKNYARLWQNFIPEEQRHGFERGGWFYVEVIPHKLAVFSLNTLYFFDHNSAVDGCAARSEPGWEHMEWLRIQLQFIRERGMKAILMGHVPPARTESKQLWDETCWQKYTLWLKQYRDVVIGGIYGHMNIDHFLLQDTKEIDLEILVTLDHPEALSRAHLDDELTINSASDYLEELREGWSKLPNLSLAFTDALEDDALVNFKRKKNKCKGGKSKRDKNLKKIGGHWGERYQITYIGPSVVPNYFPTLRVIEYNVTGLEDALTWQNRLPDTNQLSPEGMEKELERRADVSNASDMVDIMSIDQGNISKSEKHVEKAKKKGKKGKKRKKPKTPSDPDLTIPPPPSKSTPPGPAYSPQTLTLLGYTQYFANLTHINNEIVSSTGQGIIHSNSWHEGKHKGKQPKDKEPLPKEFEYKIEYSTFNDSDFDLDDMTVPSYLKLAHRIGQYKPPKCDEIRWQPEDDELPNNDAIRDEKRISSQGICPTSRWWLLSIFERTIFFRHHRMLFEHWLVRPHVIEVDQGIETEKRNDDRDEIGRKTKDRDKAWLAFIKRAFVGTMDQDSI